MKKVVFINWAPFALGLLLLVVAKVDIYQFESQTIEVRAMLSRELPIAILGFILSIVIFLSTIYWLVKNKWTVAIQTVISPILWYGCFIAGSLMGGAFMNAT